MAKKIPFKTQGKAMTDFRFSLPKSMLQQFLCFIYTVDNPKVKKLDILRVKDLVESANKEIYVDDPDGLVYVQIINNVVSTIIDKDIVDPVTIKALVETQVKTCGTNIPAPQTIASEKTIDFTRDLLRSYLANKYFYERLDSLTFALQEARDASPLQYDQVVKHATDLMREIIEEQNKVASNEDRIGMNLRELEFRQTVQSAHAELSNPSHRLKTCMQGFNTLTNGGLELGRCVIILGLSGEGKSGFMLNLAVQIKAANKGYQTRNPNLKPCIVYMSQENSMQETVERLYAITTGNEEFARVPADEVVDRMRNIGNLRVTDDDPINIFIFYRSPYTNTTAEFGKITDQLEEEGYEVICFMHDYVQRIHADHRRDSDDLRKELGQIINEEATFAKERNILFITAGQLNRAADDKINDLREHNKTNLVSAVRRSNIGESIMMINNADTVIALAREVDPDTDQLFLGIRTLKNRARASYDGDTIYQPFYPGSQIRLQTDLDLPVPVCQTTADRRKRANPNSSRANRTLEEMAGVIQGNNTVYTTNNGKRSLRIQPDRPIPIDPVTGLPVSDPRTWSPLKDPSFEEPYDGNGYWEIMTEEEIELNPATYSGDMMSLLRGMPKRDVNSKKKALAFMETIGVMPFGDIVDPEAVAVTTQQCYEAEKDEPITTPGQPEGFVPAGKFDPEVAAKLRQIAEGSDRESLKTRLSRDPLFSQGQINGMKFICITPNETKEAEQPVIVPEVEVDEFDSLFVLKDGTRVHIDIVDIELRARDIVKYLSLEDPANRYKTLRRTEITYLVAGIRKARTMAAIAKRNKASTEDERMFYQSIIDMKITEEERSIITSHVEKELKELGLYVETAKSVAAPITIKFSDEPVTPVVKSQPEPSSAISAAPQPQPSAPTAQPNTQETETAAPQPQPDDTSDNDNQATPETVEEVVTDNSDNEQPIVETEEDKNQRRKSEFVKRLCEKFTENLENGENQETSEEVVPESDSDNEQPDVETEEEVPDEYVTDEEAEEYWNRPDEELTESERRERKYIAEVCKKIFGDPEPKYDPQEIEPGYDEREAMAAFLRGERRTPNPIPQQPTDGVDDLGRPLNPEPGQRVVDPRNPKYEFIYDWPIGWRRGKIGEPNPFAYYKNFFKDWYDTHLGEYPGDEGYKELCRQQAIHDSKVRGRNDTMAGEIGFVYSEEEKKRRVQWYLDKCRERREGRKIEDPGETTIKFWSLDELKAAMDKKYPQGYKLGSIIYTNVKQEDGTYTLAIKAYAVQSLEEYEEEMATEKYIKDVERYERQMGDTMAIIAAGTIDRPNNTWTADPNRFAGSRGNSPEMFKTYINPETGKKVSSWEEEQELIAQAAEQPIPSIWYTCEWGVHYTDTNGNMVLCDNYGRPLDIPGQQSPAPDYTTTQIPHFVNMFRTSGSNPPAPEPEPEEHRGGFFDVPWLKKVYDDYHASLGKPHVGPKLTDTF